MTDRLVPLWIALGALLVINVLLGQVETQHFEPVAVRPTPAAGLPDYCDMIQACSGPLWRQTNTCNTWCQCSATADVDRDFDVDLEDFAEMQRRWTGPR